MSSSVRYKYVKNFNAGPLLASDLIGNDGDDKKERKIKRVVSAGDIGTAAGQLGHNYGALADILPMTETVLMVEGLVYRPGVAQQGMTPYNLVDNQIDAIPPTTSAEISYGVGLDNSIRVIDKGHAGPAALDVGDVIMIRITIGTRQSSSDVMNS